MADLDQSEDRLYRDRNLAQFYDLENGWAPDFVYCLGLAQDARSVLDLGCGTGQLAARLADSRVVFGADPAEAMLEIARGRPGGDKVTWVRSEAQSLRLDREFDLVVLTGHAFQVFLTASDQRAALATIAAHLAPGGRFIFDTRNPAAVEWREWRPEGSMRDFAHPRLGKIKAWSDAAHDPASGIVTYETHYEAVDSGERFSASSKILFAPREPLAAMLDQAGLEVDEWLGDWQGGHCTAMSPDFIPIGHRR